jgi:hypothetical protein
MCNVDDANRSVAEHAAREDANAGQVLSTAKLVTTFSAALAATFLATALQVGKPTFDDYLAAWAMLAVLVITIGIVCLPKATLNPDHFGSKGDSKTPDIAEIQQTIIANARTNLCRARWVHRVMVAQVILSSLVSVVAVIEIILWLRGNPPH